MTLRSVLGEPGKVRIVLFPDSTVQAKLKLRKAADLKSEIRVTPLHRWKHAATGHLPYDTRFPGPGVEVHADSSVLSGVISGPLADSRGSVLDARGYQGPCPVLTAGARALTGTALFGCCLFCRVVRGESGWPNGSASMFSSAPAGLVRSWVFLPRVPLRFTRGYCPAPLRGCWSPHSPVVSASHALCLGRGERPGGHGSRQSLCTSPSVQDVGKRAR